MIPLGAEGNTEWVLAGILAAVTVLFVLAYLTRIPYPIWLTLGGAVIGLVPGTPEVTLEPDLVLIIVLPPLLYSAAFFSDLRELRRNAVPIGMLAVGLVIATTFAVAAVAHWLVGLSWEAAIVLGAVLGPTDPVAATAIAGRVGAPRRIVAVLEGESLINDATALVAFRFAVAAATAGTFSLLDASMEFVLGVAGGIAIGLAVGHAVAELRARIDDTPTEAVLSLVTPYFAYLPADAIDASGVLAAVTAGIYLGWRAPRLITPTTRIQLYALWTILIFLLNSLLFVLVGLQLSGVIDALEGEPAGTLTGYAVAVALTVMLVRFAWVFPFTMLSRIWERGETKRMGWKSATVVAFTGMRGAVSLAAALAIPTDVAGRDLIIFLCFTTILWTVCLEGLTLPALLRWLGVRDDGFAVREEEYARMRAAEAAMGRVDDLADETWVREDTAKRVRAMHDFRRRRFGARLGKLRDGEVLDEDPDARSADYQRLLAEVLDAQRDALFQLRREGLIGDEVLRRVERDLDLEFTRLDAERAG